MKNAKYVCILPKNGLFVFCVYGVSGEQYQQLLPVLRAVEQERVTQAALALDLQERLRQTQKEMTALQNNMNQRDLQLQKLHTELQERTVQINQLEREVRMAT